MNFYSIGCKICLQLFFLLIIKNAIAQTYTLNDIADVNVGFHDNFGSADNNYGSANHFSAFYQPGAAGGANGARSIVSFDLTIIPDGATVISAYLNLYGRGPYGVGDAVSIGNTGENQCFIERVTQDWGEYTATWNDQPTTTSQNAVLIGPSTSTIEDMTIDVTQLVIDMLADPTNSFGFELRLVTEDFTRSLAFWSREATDPDKRPTLVVNIGCVLPELSMESFASSCQEETGSIELAVNGGLPPYTFLWSNGSTLQNLNLIDSGTYTVTVIDANNCIVIGSAYVGLSYDGIVTAITDTIVCMNSLLQLNSNYSGTLNWYSSSSLICTCPAPAVIIEQATYYIAVPEDECFMPDTVFVEVYDEFVSAGTDTFVIEGDGIYLNGIVSSGNFSWCSDPTLSCFDCLSPYASPVSTTTYCLELQGDYCVLRDTVIVYVLSPCNNITLPNSFSPNGDGLNDFFRPINITQQQFSSMQIFNRWGNIIYESTDYKKGWDGRNNNTDQEIGNYVYLLKFRCGNEVKNIFGNLLLLR